jgi:hypothetical protein
MVQYLNQSSSDEFKLKEIICAYQFMCSTFGEKALGIQLIDGSVVVKMDVQEVFICFCHAA